MISTSISDNACALIFSRSHADSFENLPQNALNFKRHKTRQDRWMDTNFVCYGDNRQCCEMGNGVKEETKRRAKTNVGTYSIAVAKPFPTSCYYYYYYFLRNVRVLFAACAYIDRDTHVEARRRRTANGVRVER